jgi:putative SOS response-associated peptidase YedK
MCFYFRASKKVLEMLNEKYKNLEDELRNEFADHDYNGFQHPSTPVVTQAEPGRVQLMNWGLIPHWAKDRSIQNNTLNAKMETLAEKPSFRNVLNNRCLVFADGFYEWQWLDPAGKQKQKYLITLPDAQPFAFAGLWSRWNDPQTGFPLNTYTLITRPADELMSRIHNSKLRMPWILQPGDEQAYLHGEAVAQTEHRLVATAV